jgi:hypothetical protein
MKQANFSIDTFPGQLFEGFSNDEDWNGWACPYFPLEEAQKIVEAHKVSGQNAWFDEENDEFVFKVNNETESYPALNYDGQKLYPIGYGAWIWEESGD